MPTPEEIRKILGEEKGSTPWTPGDPLYVEIWGKWGEGKSHFAGTFDLPIYWFDFDHNIREVWATYQREGKGDRLGQIFKISYLLPIKGNQAEARTLAESFQKDYYGAIGKLAKLLAQTGIRGTVVLDPMTAVWDLFQYAYVPWDDEGKVRSAFSFGEANMRFDALLQRAKQAGVHVVMPTRSKNRWIKGEKGWEKTDILDADAKDIVHSHATVVIEVHNQATFDPKSQKSAVRRRYRITKCTPNGKLKGHEQEDSLDYETLLQLIESY